MSDLKSSKKPVGVEDMVLLTKIEVPSIAENLQKRLMADLIYSYIGEVLIAVNPFKQLSYFTAKELDMYQNAASYENPPHIYCLCDTVFRSMLNDAENQCVIISGESGAGKTVSAKHVMNYITKVSGGGDNVAHVKEVILKSNPLLEAFGNAKTLRNDNSSRFGKYVEILFKTGGIPIGGRISNFLLEKSRVTCQNKGERNYHIFYQILAGLDSSKKNEYCLTVPEDFKYLSQSECFSVNGVDDAKDFEEVKEAIDVIGLPKEISEAIMRLSSGVLHLGNLDFKEEGNSAVLINDKHLKLAAKLFKVDSDELLGVIITRNMESKWGKTSETIKITHNQEQALFARDAISKAVYARIFSYLVEAVNIAIDKKDCERSIGILDIYGFEIFQCNGFEQFCINFVNEKLQQIFIELTLKREQEEYVSENIQWTPVKYFNNKNICDLIENAKNPSGIMSILDDVCATMHAKSEGADEKLVTDLSTAINNNHFFISGAGFTITHYAGKVTYDVKGFCEKNRDVLFNDPIDLMKKSGCKFLASLFPEDTNAEKKGRPTTAGAKIKNQAGVLVEKLMKCHPHYIRCIKPNETKKAYDFDMARVKHQIEYQGLKENIRIKRAGFAYRRPFAIFVQRYAILTPETYPKWKGEAKDGVVHLLNSVEMEKSEWQLGISKVFIKSPESLFLLEELRDRKFEGYARIIQKGWRQHNNQSVYDKEKLAACELVVNKKERYHATINRKYYGNYYNFDDQPILLTFIEKKESVLFSAPVVKYDRRFKTALRDLLVTQKHLYMIGREKVDKGPNKGKILDICKRKIPLREIKKIQMSQYQDDFLVIEINEDYSSLIETPLKTELVYIISKNFKKLAEKPLTLDFTNNMTVMVKKSGFKLKSQLPVVVQQDQTLKNDVRVIKPSMSKLLILIKPGSPSSSKPTANIQSTAKRAAPPADSAKNASTPSSRAPPPATPKPKGKKQCRALYDYNSGKAEELVFNANDIIDIEEENDDGWWKGSIGGRSGFFPYNYIEKL